MNLSLSLTARFRFGAWPCTGTLVRGSVSQCAGRLALQVWHETQCFCRDSHQSRPQWMQSLQGVLRLSRVFLSHCCPRRRGGVSPAFHRLLLDSDKCYCFCDFDLSSCSTHQSSSAAIQKSFVMQVCTSFDLSPDIQEVQAPVT